MFWFFTGNDIRTDSIPRLGAGSGISVDVRFGVDIPVSIVLKKQLNYLSSPHHLWPVRHPKYNAQNGGNDFFVAATELGEATGHARLYIKSPEN